MIKYIVIGNLRGACASVKMLKGYILICRNAEGVHGKSKVGNPCFTVKQLYILYMRQLWNKLQLR